MQLQQEIRELTMKKEELELVLEEHKRTGCKVLANGVLGVPCGRASPPDIKPIVPISSAACGGLPKPGCLPIKQEAEILDPLTLSEQHYMNPQFCAAASAAAPPPKKTCFGLGGAPHNKPPRPTSLNVAAAFTPAPSNMNMRGSNNLSEVAGIPISTPSSGMFNFDSLMEGGTGLTPVSGPLVPSCSSQQRNHNSVGDLSSPDSNISNKLVSL